MSEKIKPNAFVFKVFIDGKYRLCVCPRIDDEWSEKDIFYVNEPGEQLINTLDDTLFHIIFIVYEKDETGGFWLKPGDDPMFLKSDTNKSAEMYSRGQFFPTIEKGYQQLYGQQSNDINEQSTETTDGDETNTSGSKESEQSSGEGESVSSSQQSDI